MPLPPKPPPKKLPARVAPNAKNKPAANDAQVRDEVNSNDEPSPAPVDALRAIAPLWDLPEKNVRIPVDSLDMTLVFRWVLDDAGQMQRSHCGNLPATATGEEIRRKWGGGRFFLQARIGQRVVASQNFMVEGPEINQQLPFGPVGELKSGLVTLQSDPQTAAIFALFQMWQAAERSDFQLMLQMQQNVLEKLASQFGASMVVTNLKEQLLGATSRIAALEKLLDEGRERERQAEKDALKRKYKGDSTSWVEIVEAVGEIAPAVLQALPPKVKALLEGLATDAAKQLPGGGVPPGVTAIPDAG